MMSVHVMHKSLAPLKLTLLTVTLYDTQSGSVIFCVIKQRRPYPYPPGRTARRIANGSFRLSDGNGIMDDLPMSKQGGV